VSTDRKDLGRSVFGGRKSAVYDAFFSVRHGSSAITAPLSYKRAIHVTEVVNRANEALLIRLRGRLTLAEMLEPGRASWITSAGLGTGGAGLGTGVGLANSRSRRTRDSRAIGLRGLDGAWGGVIGGRHGIGLGGAVAAVAAGVDLAGAP
jgi:hypothetical protein